MLNIIFLIAAVIGGTIMVCQFLLTVIGFSDHGSDGGDFADAGGHDAFDHGGIDDGDLSGHDGDLSGNDGEASDHGAHHDANWLFGIITFRTLVAACAFFGIAGAAASSAGWGGSSALGVALAAGFSAMYGMYWLMRQISRLASSGNERISNALGRRATVYIPIPASGGGMGKVQLSMQNRIVEFQAVTEGSEPLKTGETVEVVAVSGSDLVSVRRVAEPVDA